MGVEMHMKEKFILQGSKYSLYCVQQFFHALSTWLKLKLQLKLKQWFDTTEMENAFFLCLLSLLCPMVPGPTLLFYAFLCRLWCSSPNGSQRAIAEKPQQKGPVNKAEFSVHKQEQTEVTSLQVANLELLSCDLQLRPKYEQNIE